MRSNQRQAHTRLGTGKPYGVEGTHRLAEGVEFTLGSREIEIDHQLSREDFLSGRCFGRGGIPVAATTSSRSSAAKQFIPLKPRTINGGKSTSTSLQSTLEKTKEKRGVDLEAVNLTGSGKSLEKSPASNPCWTANW